LHIVVTGLNLVNLHFSAAFEQALLALPGVPPPVTADTVPASASVTVLDTSRV
jgi:hypothetical protein